MKKKDVKPKPNTAQKRRSRIRKRRLLFVLLIFVLAVGFFAGGIYYAVSKFLTVSQITVCGSSMYSVEEITELSGLKTDGSDNIVFFSGRKIRDTLREKLPYIKEAKVYRSYPDTVIIEVMPDEPFATVTDGTQSYLLDSDMKILASADGNEYDYLAISSAIDEEQSIGRELTFKDEKTGEVFDEIITQTIKYDLLEKMNSIKLDDIFDIFMIYDDRIQIAFGDYGEIASKIQFAANIISMRAENDKGVVDVTSVEQAYFRLTRS